MCRSLEEFRSLPSDKLHWYAKLQEPWRLGFLCGARMEPLHLLNPSKQPDLYVNIKQLHKWTSWLIWFQTQHAFIYCLHWSPQRVEIPTLVYKRTLSVDQKCFQWHTVPIYFSKTNAKKSEISTKTDVYSYRRPHRCASRSAGVLCRGCGPVTCNTQLSIY